MLSDEENPARQAQAMAETGAMGFRDMLGFDVPEWSEDWAVVTLELNERHFNRNGYVHGGVIMSLLDSACGLCGVYCDIPGNVRRSASISMNTQFFKPASHGVLRTEGKLVTRGQKIFFAEAKMFNGNTLVAAGTGEYRYVAGGGDINGVPGK